MLTVIQGLLQEAETSRFRSLLDGADWQDGRATAGGIARHVKRNGQLDDTVEPAVSLGNHILRRLAANPRFVSAALPQRIYPPKFNRYVRSEAYGDHVDGALMQIPGTGQSLRTDLSVTVFLSDPGEYEGGELIIDTRYGSQSVKLPAGDMVLYPASSLHRVSPVTKGARLASFFWVQSLVPDSQRRDILFDLDQSVQQLTSELGETHGEVVRLSGLYHNLVRRWAQT